MDPIESARGSSAAPSAWLLVLALLFGLASKATSPPVYFGAIDGPPPSRLDALRAPFGDDLRGDCGAFLSAQAAGLLREGLAATGGIPLLNVRPAPREFFWYYDHHTPGCAWVTAAAFALFGEQEWVARCVALSFSLLLLVVLFFALRPAGTAATAFGLAAALTAPAGWFWGTHLNYEVPALPFVLAFLVAAERSRTNGRALFLVSLAFLFDLVAVFALLARALEEVWLRERRPAWRRAALWLASSGLLLGAWWAWKTAQLSRYGTDGGSDLLSYLKAVSILAPSLDLLEFSRTIAGHVLLLFGPVLPGVLVLECLLSLRRAERARSSSRILRSSTIVGLLVLLVPAVRSLGHEYYALHLLAPVALATGRLAARIAAWAPWRGRASAALAGSAGLLVVVLPGIRTEFVRPEPSSEHPSNHRLGRELRTRSAAHDGALFCVPAGTSFRAITVSYYAGFPVEALPADDPTGYTYRRDFLYWQGLPLERLFVAEDPAWPGRGGERELPVPQLPQDSQEPPGADGQDPD